MRRTRRWGAALATGLAAVLAATLPGTASAEVVDRGVVEEDLTETFEDFCGADGLTVEVRTLFRVSYTVVARRPGTDPYFLNRIRVEQTFTNPATGAVATATETTVNKDLAIRRDGDLLTILVLATGNATVRDATGKAIARNPGQTRFEVVIDDNGTPEDPDDDVEVSFEVVKGSTGRSDDFCAALVGALG